MDAGIAALANLSWLREQGHHYAVVTTLRERQFDPAPATSTQSAGDVTIQLQREQGAPGEVLLYGHSPAREQKDRAIVTAITWVKRIKPGSAAAHPGMYCLRTPLVEQDNATLWRTYSMLTELKSVFRSLKTDLGPRPVFHRVDRRVEGHLFISVLACHFVNTLRLQLKQHGINDSWNTLRPALATQRRVTVTLQRRDGRCVHMRKATRPKPRHQTLGTLLKLDPNPGHTQRVLV